MDRQTLELLLAAVGEIEKLRARVENLEVQELKHVNRLLIGASNYTPPISMSLGVLATQSDAYIEGDEAGIKYRLRSHGTNISEDFDVSSLPAGWSWASSPFITPATVDFSLPSILRIGFSATAGERSFLYKSAAPSSDLFASVGANSLTTTFQTGIRIDDGSDNNYVELYLRISGVSPNTYLIRSTYRTGGGAVNTADSDSWKFPVGPPIIYMSFSGTKWSSWSARPLITFPFSIGMISWLPTIVSSLTWTPTRTGLIFDDGSGTATWERALVDFIGGF